MTFAENKLHINDDLLENRCDELGIFELRDFAKCLKSSNRKNRVGGGGEEGRKEEKEGRHEGMP